MTDNVAAVLTSTLATPILTTDRQTGLPTLIRFYGELHNLLRSSQTLTLVVCYLDQAVSEDGDAAIRLARLLSETLQTYPQARIFRTAADSFALILPGTGRPEGLRLAETLRQRFEREAGGLTTSFAVAGAPHDANEPGALIAVCEMQLVFRTDSGNRVYAATPAETLPPGTTRLLNLLISRLVTLVELSHQLDETERQALHDPVTGLPNSRSLDQMLPRFVERGARTSTPLALLLIDGDSLKEYNTAFGYEAGNEWIRRVARTLAGNIRPGDYIARWFVGDEFIVLLPDTNATQALEVAERLRAAIEVAGLSSGGFGTVSIGVALAHGMAVPAVLLNTARDALLLAKDAGKNRVVLGD